MVGTTKRCVLGMVRGCGNRSGLFVYAGRPHTYERSLFVQTEPFGRLELCSSVSNIVRLIHGKLSCANPCRLGLSKGYRRMLVVGFDRNQRDGKDWMKLGYRTSKECSVVGAGMIRDKDRDSVRPAG